mmetsp:Transcript_2836/g.10310  ORF Transcript_2836/g.10310 Transcript_2836/m.10310 type:complete len:161 (+) Transcript_2836:179-661(+)
MAAGQFYGPSGWDPVQIVAQIVSMQCLFYLSYGLLILVLIGPYETLTVDFIFNWRYMELQSYAGVAVAGCYFINALVGSAFLLLVVERSKKCLDFTVTQYFLHGMMVLSHSGVPSSVIWWLNTALCIAVMAVAGEWLCMRRELRDIPLSKQASRTSVEQV